MFDDLAFIAGLLAVAPLNRASRRSWDSRLSSRLRPQKTSRPRRVAPPTASLPSPMTEDSPPQSETASLAASPSQGPALPNPGEKSFPNKWAVVTAASIVHALHAACVYMAPSTLMSPMRASLGLSVADITKPLIAFRTIQALFLIPGGFVLDAVGPQRALRLAITAAALLAPLLPLVTSLTQLIVLQSLLAFTKLFGGLSALLLIMTGVFPDGKGFATATSVLLSGYSFAGFLAPAAIGTISDSLGWQAAFHMLSLAFITIAVPLTFHYLREPGRESRGRERSSSMLILLRRAVRRIVSRDPPSEDRAEAVSSNSAASLRRRPSSGELLSTQGSTSRKEALRSKASGLRRQTRGNFPFPDGEPSSMSEASHESSALINDDESPAPHEKLFTLPFLTIALAVASFSFSMHIMFDHLIVFLSEDFGMPFYQATMYMSAVNLIALFAKLGVGPVADRMNKALLIAFFSIVAMFASLLLLDFTGLTFATTSSLVKVIGFVVLYSIGYASVFSLTTSVMPEFGKQKLGVRSNFNLVMLFGSGSIASYAAGVVRSSTGSYRWPFMWNSIAFMVAGLCGLVKFFAFDCRQSSAQVVIAMAGQSKTGEN